MKTSQEMKSQDRLSTFWRWWISLSGNLQVTLVRFAAESEHSKMKISASEP